MWTTLESSKWCVGQEGKSQRKEGVLPLSQPQSSHISKRSQQEKAEACLCLASHPLI